MTDYEALDILRAQGHAAGIPDRNGWVRVYPPRSVKQRRNREFAAGFRELGSTF